MKKLFAVIGFVCAFAQSDLFAGSLAKPEKLQELLIGPVQKVRIELGTLKQVDSQWIPKGPKIPWLETHYDKNGYRVEEEQFYTEKSLDFKSVFHYDSEGNLSEGVEYDYQGAVTFNWTYLHDRDRKVIEKKQFFPNGDLFSITTFVYDETGNLLEEKRFLEQTKNQFRWTYDYNKSGRKLEESYYLMRPGRQAGEVKTMLNFRAVFGYDDRGNLVEETKYDASGKLSSKRRFQYEYDPIGNWITQTAFGSAGPTVAEITYRTITYFPQ
ncbi:MAG: hypothetical protein ACE5GK_03205 [Nitrospiria bacterium]